jgi:hypothetical protein
MMTNNSEILERLPDAKSIRERLRAITAERNLLKPLLNLLERHEFRGADRQRKQPDRQAVAS